MGDFIQVRSVKHIIDDFLTEYKQQKKSENTIKQYFNDFLVEGLKHNTKVTESDIVMIKHQILDAFRKEIFERITDKIGAEAANMSREELFKLDAAKNIMDNCSRKWKRLCIICSEKGLGNIFQLDDLSRSLEEEEPDPQEIIYGEDPGKDVTDQMDDILPEGEEPVFLESDAHLNTET